MNIMFISGSFPDMRCGIGEYTARLASELAQTDARPSILVLTHETSSTKITAAAPAQVHTMRMRWGVRSLPRILIEVRRVRPDLVHLQYPSLGYFRVPAIMFLPLLIRLFCRRPVVTTIHEFRERRWPWRLATLFIALTANAVLVPDVIEAKHLRHALKGAGHKITVIGMISTVPVIRDANLSILRAQLAIVESDVVLATFGLIHPRRRLELLVETIQELRHRQVRAHLLVIGGEAEYDLEVAQTYSEQIHRQVSAYGLNEFVHWFGFVDAATVSTLLQLCTTCVLLYPSGASQRNTTLQTALEHGVQIITTSGTATPRELQSRDDITFLSVDSVTPKVLAEAIVDVAHKLPYTTASSGLQQHLEHHLAIYNHLVARKN